MSEKLTKALQGMLELRSPGESGPVQISTPFGWLEITGDFIHFVKVPLDPSCHKGYLRPANDPSEFVVREIKNEENS